MATRQLNIVHLHGHDAGRFFQPYGYNTPTPSLQTFAEQGVVFRRAFCAAPTCSPSRAAMLTGEYPHVCGMFGLASDAAYFEINDYSHHLSSYLKANGYATAVAGTTHETRGFYKPLAEMGYDEWLNEKERGAPCVPQTLGAAVRFIERDHVKPFFLSCGFLEPHRDNQNQGRRHSHEANAPFVEEQDGRYRRPPAMIPDTPLTRRDWASFCDGVRRLDRKMGIVIEAIDRAGLAESTLIIVTTDHGIAWPHGKGNLTDMGTGVMLMMRGPKGSGLEGGRVIDAMVSQMDVFPTLCDLNGLPRPEWLAGVSMMPLIQGKAESIREHVFCEQNWHGWRFDPQRSIRGERYKYIRRKAVEHVRIVDPGPTNDWFRSLNYHAWPAGEELLYDLYFDPLEMQNLVDDARHAEVLNDLRRRLDAKMAETNDPFVTDTIPSPVDFSKVPATQS